MSRHPATFERLRGLPPQQEIINRDAANVVAERLRHGELPVIAPKFIFRTPMWVHHRTAALCTPRYSRKWNEILPQGTPVTQVVEVVNNLPSTTTPSAHGALRYLDLDVIMALSLSWTRTQSPMVEIEQRQLFKWMGYTDLTKAPYDELKCSLKRLENTQIAIYQEGSDPRRISPFRLIDGVNFREEQRSRGSPLIISTTLNRVWEAALAASDWQAVDLIGYARLVRDHRMIGLARVIYLYLASWRKPDGSFEVPMWSIRERFAQVRPDGTLKYHDPFNASGMLMKALTVLHRSGVMSLDDVRPKDIHTKVLLTGRFVRIEDPDGGARQQWLIAPGMWDEGHATVIDGPVKPAAGAPAPPAAPSASPALDLPDAKMDPVKARLIKDVRRLKRLVPVSRKMWDKAIADGWRDSNLKNLLVVVLWMHGDGRIRDPAAFAASELANKEASAYEGPALALAHDLPAIQAWVRSVAGPLYDPQDLIDDLDKEDA